MNVELELSDSHELEIQRLIKKGGVKDKSDFFIFAVNLYLHSISQIEMGREMVFRDPINNINHLVVYEGLTSFNPLNDNIPQQAETEQ